MPAAGPPLTFCMATCRPTSWGHFFFFFLHGSSIRSTAYLDLLENSTGREHWGHHFKQDGASNIFTDWMSDSVRDGLAVVDRVIAPPPPKKLRLTSMDFWSRATWGISYTVIMQSLLLTCHRLRIMFTGVCEEIWNSALWSINDYSAGIIVAVTKTWC